MKPKVGSERWHRETERLVKGGNRFYDDKPLKQMDYEFNIEEILESDNQNCPQFRAENRPYAEIQLAHTAPIEIGNIAYFDQNYINKKVESNSWFSEWNEFALMYCCTKQIISTFDSKTQYKLAIVRENLQSEVKLPSPWIRAVHLLGDLPEDTGVVKLKHPIQAVIDFLMSGLRAIIGYKGEKTNDLKSQYLETLRIRGAKDSYDEVMLIGKTVDQEKSHYHILSSEPESVLFAKAMCRQMWNEFVKETKFIKTLGDNKTFTFMFQKAEYWESMILNNVDLTHPVEKNFAEFRTWLKETGVNAKIAGWLSGLMEVIVYGKPKGNSSNLSQFLFIENLTLERLSEITSDAFRIYQEVAPPVMNKIYKTEVFIPSKKGSRCQQIVVNPDGRNFSSKINLRGYPVTLALMFPLTRSIDIVRNVYTTMTDLSEESATAFVNKDSKLLSK